MAAVAADRALLAALLHRLPRDVMRGVRLLVRPDTLLRWHRDLIADRHAMAKRRRKTLVVCSSCHDRIHTRA